MFKMSVGHGETRFCKKLDSLFWWILRLLPLFFILLMLWGHARNGTTDTYANGDVFNKFGYVFRSWAWGWEGSPIYKGLRAVFCGPNAFLPITSSPDSDFLLYFTYLINLELIHIMVDFLLFIPRLCHKWLNVWTQSD